MTRTLSRPELIAWTRLARIDANCPAMSWMYSATWLRVGAAPEPSSWSSSTSKVSFCNFSAAITPFGCMRYNL